MNFATESNSLRRLGETMFTVAAPVGSDEMRRSQGPE